MTKQPNREKYVDGFVFSVPEKNVAAYKKMAREGARIWKQFGALDYKECKGDELVPKKAPGMPVPLTFTKIAGAKKGETVWFSFITFKSKAHRNQVNKKVMQYFNEKYADKKDEPMPFDVRRMAYGGFSVEVD